jgi:predicted kinase
MKSELHVLVGMIASGKSTYCSKAVKHGCLVMSDDAIVNLLHANHYGLYDKSLKKLYKSIENHVASTALCLDRIVLIDRGLNVSKSSRRRWVALANCFDVPCKAIVFPKESPGTHACRRYYSDNRGHSYEYWEDVAKKHDEVYNEPTIEEGFDEICHVTWVDDNISGVFL